MKGLVVKMMIEFYRLRNDNCWRLLHCISSVNRTYFQAQIFHKLIKCQWMIG
jgi:hypothetical protein